MQQVMHDDAHKCPNCAVQLMGWSTPRESWVLYLIAILFVMVEALAGILGAVRGIHGECAPWPATREEILIPTSALGCRIGHWFR